MLTTAAILGQIKARIEALTPTDPAGVDDVFHCAIGINTHLGAPRTTLLTAQLPRRRPGAGRTSQDWQTSVDIETFYPDVPGELDRYTVYQRAVEDAEAILADLENWAVTTLGILRIEPELGSVTDNGNGSLVAVRSILVSYERA